ncbi:ABC transporter permease [Glaciecola sp. MH2013]|uniref:ABC transporter permease n=1 Tax=Glaciecola sp. MH2013 TaxID=2785524 RepID=UPI00189DFD86|nr:ABC transporter permease [Glaciecola sp. MH2013]MBF7073485.1 ABC transporter permease [Glaciecola sp. MH2013]
MNLTSLKAFFILDMKITFRERVSLAMLLLMPAIFYLFFASFYNTPTEGATGLDYYNNYTVSFVSIILLSIALMNLGPVIVMSKEAGFYKRLMVSPLNMSEIWLTSILRALIIFTIGYAEMILLGYLMFDQLPQASIIQLVIPALISAFALLSLGFLIGALFNASVAAFNVGMIIFQPMMLLSGAGYPLELMPEWAKTISYFIPFTYVVEIMRLGWSDNFFTQQSVLPCLILALMGIACAVISAKTFRSQAL